MILTNSSLSEAPPTRKPLMSGLGVCVCVMCEGNIGVMIRTRSIKGDIGSKGRKDDRTKG